MKKIILTLTIAANFFASFALAKPIKVPKSAIAHNLEQKKAEFRKFYADELLWIRTFLVPVSSDLIQSHKKLKAYNDEVATWGSIADVEQKQDILVKVRAQSIAKDIDRDFALLFVAFQNLRAAGEKHQAQVEPFYRMVGEIGSLYQDLDSKLKLVLGIYHQHSVGAQLSAQAAEAAQKLEALLTKNGQQRVQAEVGRITLFLSRAERYQSRTLWLSALAQYNRMMGSADLVRAAPQALETIYRHIREREVSIENAKRALLERLDGLRSEDAQDEAFEKRFVEFMLEPHPDNQRFIDIEKQVLELETRKQATSSWYQPNGGLMLCSTFSEPLAPGETEVTTKVYTREFNLNGADVTNVVIETYFSDSTGHRSMDRSEGPLTKDIGERVRKYAGISNNDPINFSETKRMPSDDTLRGELSARSPTAKTQTKVQKYTKGNEDRIDVTIGEPVTPEAYQDRTSRIYGQSFHDRADIYSGATDLSKKTHSFNSKLADKATALAGEIQAGETALGQAFGSVMKHLSDELYGSSALPEGSNLSRPPPSEANIRQSIATTRRVLKTLHEKNQGSTHPEQAQVQRGLDAAATLLHSAESAVNTGDLNSATAFLDLAHRIIGQYGATALHIGAGFTPLGDVIDVIELVTGLDAITGEPLTAGDRFMAAAGLIIGSRALWSAAAEHMGDASKAALRQAEEFASGVKTRKTYDALTKGPMSNLVVDKETGALAVDTFRSGKYDMITRTKKTTVYRSSTAGFTGSNFWALQPPAGPTATIIDFALPGAKNSALRVFVGEIPAGKRFAVGVVREHGKLVGGGIQAVIEDPSVIQAIKEVFK